MSGPVELRPISLVEGDNVAVLREMRSTHLRAVTLAYVEPTPTDSSGDGRSRPTTACR